MDIPQTPTPPGFPVAAVDPAVVQTVADEVLTALEARFVNRPLIHEGLTALHLFLDTWVGTVKVPAGASLQQIIDAVLTTLEVLTASRPLAHMAIIGAKMFLDSWLVGQVQSQLAVKGVKLA